MGELGKGTLTLWINKTASDSPLEVGREYLPIEDASEEENARKEYKESATGVRINMNLRKEDQVYNITLASNWIKGHAFAKSKHICAKHVRLGMEAGGISTWGGDVNRPVAAGDYNNGFMQSRGFFEVPFKNYTPQLGDITIWEAGSWSDYGHIQMYLGNNSWGSDYIGGFYPYGKDRGVPFSIWRR